jgi:conjugal transfer ATP-binding protein TraC
VLPPVLGRNRAGQHLGCREPAGPRGGRQRGDEPLRLHSILKYDQYDPEGLFYNDNSVAFCFEVIAQTGADDDMANRLNTLFTPVPPHYGIQWCLFGSPVLDDQFQAYMDQRHIAVDNGKTTPFFQELAAPRGVHLQGQGHPLWPNDNYVVKNIRLLFSITKAGLP